MDGQILLGRDLAVVFAEENRKMPSEMRARERCRGLSYDRRGSSSHYSPSLGRGRSYHRCPSYYSPSPSQGRYSRGSFFILAQGPKILREDGPPGVQKVIR